MKAMDWGNLGEAERRDIGGPERLNHGIHGQGFLILEETERGKETELLKDLSQIHGADGFGEHLNINKKTEKVKKKIVK